MDVTICGGKTKEALKIIIELLAAVPSVVWGFIGLMVLAPLITEYTGAPVGVCLLNGGIIVALMSVPIIVSIGEDALKAVPDSYREAAIALGELGDPEAVKPLVEVLKDPELTVIQYAADALRQIGDSSAVDGLL